MPRKHLLPTLLVTVAIGGVILWQVLAGTATPPAPRPAPPGSDPQAAQPVTTDGDPSTGNDPARPAATEPDGPSIVRVAVAGDDPSAECVVELSVRVERGGRRQPAPFVDCRLRLLGEPPQDAYARTDARGMAVFTFAGGNGRSVVATSGLGGNALAVLRAGQRVPLTVTLAMRAVASGRVVDPAGIPVPDADIVLLHWPQHEEDVPRPWRIARSDRDGRFRIPLEMGGRIGAQHVLYGASPMYLLRASQPPREALVQSFELVLAGMAGTISGIVRGPGGHPVANAEVSLHSVAVRADAELPAPPRLLRSDANGRFAVHALSPGTMQWIARARGLGWQQGTVEVAAERATALTIRLPYAAVLTGTVRDGDAGLPVANAIVAAGTEGQLAYRSVRTAADGSFALDGLGAGLVQLTASDGRRTVRHALDLKPGGVATWHAVLSAAAAAIELQGSVVDATDRALAGYRVVVRQPERDPIATESAKDGTFAIPVERATGLDVRVFAPGRLATSFADVLLRDVAVGATPLTIRVAKTPVGSLTGRVVDSTYRGVPATIEVWHDQRREHARFLCDEQGRFAIPRVPVGTVYVTVRLPDHVDHVSPPLEIRAGLGTDLGTLTMALAGGLYGTLRDAFGQPPKDCRLQLILADSHRIVTAEQNGGGYRFRGLPAGTHRLVVQGSGIAGDAQPVTITAGVNQQLDIEVHPGHCRTVRVEMPNDGAERVTLAVRTLQPSTGNPNAAGSTGGGWQTARWVATGRVATGPDGARFATFETCMADGEFELVAITPGGRRASRRVRYGPGHEAPVTLRPR